MASHHMTASVVASTQPQTVVPVVSVPQPLQGGSQGIQYYPHPQGN